MEDPGVGATSVQKCGGEVVGKRKQGNPMGEAKVNSNVKALLKARALKPSNRSRGIRGFWTLELMALVTHLME